MDTVMTWIRLVLSYFVPWIAPVLLGLGLCGCGAPNIQPSDYNDPGYRPGPAAVQQLPGDLIGVPGNIIVGEPPGNSEPTVEAWYENGNMRFRYVRKRTVVIDSLIAAAIRAGDWNQVNYLLTLEQYRQERDYWMGMLKPLVDIGVGRVQNMADRANAPSQPQDRTLMTWEKWAEQAQRFGWKMPAPAASQGGGQ